MIGKRFGKGLDGDKTGLEEVLEVTNVLTNEHTRRTTWTFEADRELPFRGHVKDWSDGILVF